MEYREKIQAIRAQYLKGEITYDDARADVEVLLKVMNLKGARIAKEFGKKYTPLTFGYVFR